MSGSGRCRQRRSEIRKKQKKRAKIQKLKDCYQTVKSESERGQILAKLFKISPGYSVERFKEAV